MGLTEEKYMSLTTYRKVGTPVASPVWLVDLGDNKIGFYTSSGSGKAKRLAHTSKVIVQASDSRGRVKQGSEPIAATAELVTGDQLADITTKIRAKYGLFTKVTKLLGTIGGIIKRNRIPYGDRGVVITLPDGVA
jgi:PPOX class probable F420-dependent enzyme